MLRYSIRGACERSTSLCQNVSSSPSILFYRYYLLSRPHAVHLSKSLAGDYDCQGWLLVLRKSQNTPFVHGFKPVILLQRLMSGNESGIYFTRTLYCKDLLRWEFIFLVKRLGTSFGSFWQICFYICHTLSRPSPPLASYISPWSLSRSTSANTKNAHFACCPCTCTEISWNLPPLLICNCSRESIFCTDY